MTPVGVDIAKLKFDVAALINGKYKSKTFSNTPAGIKQFSQWLTRFESPHVTLEATGRYGEALSIALADSGVKISIVNPSRIAAFAKTELARSKTDKEDAKLIARFCELHRPSLWQPPPRSQRQLQMLVRRLDNLLQMKQMENNRLEGADAVVLSSLNAVLATLETQIQATRAQISDHIDNDPDLRNRRDLLDTIPGLGEATIPVILSALGEPQRFSSQRQVAAFAGLNPAEHQSGERRGKTRLSKKGDSLLRKALYMPAMVAWRHNPTIRNFCERLKSRGKAGKAIVGAAMRKLLCLAYAVLKSGVPYDPKRVLAR